ncbi:Uncharacterized protein dnm_086070 [Desulfonema magnum]|uniref:Uncharacterized protein n=1 Tax=Desulfonema magnum TaxID=45655 RepID=A0A975BVI8_9BACT|nr:Uncharacterized protein dnm_086070 [Desulfonema magnum]
MEQGFRHSCESRNDRKKVDHRVKGLMKFGPDIRFIPPRW